MTPPAHQPPPSMLTPVATAAALANVPTATVLDWIAAGQVRAERIKRAVYVCLDDVLALAEPPTQPSSPAKEGGPNDAR